MAPNSSVGIQHPRGATKPRDMALVSVSLIAISLIWAGTHQMGLAQMRDTFSAVEWGLAIGLLVAGGFLFTSLVIDVDIRQRFDAWTFVAIGGIPTAVLGYCVYAMAVGKIRVLDKLLGWAIPYGHVGMGLLIGFAIAAAVQARPPPPVVTAQSLSTLSIPE